jgi:molybdenum cofactor cytidylyltransferase
VVPIVLAAGESRRMGEPKPLLRLDGGTFLERILSQLAQAGLPEPVVVAHPAIADLLGRFGARVVVNPHPREGMLSSLRVGIRALPSEATHALVCLVDMPLVTAGTFAAVARHAAAHPGRIVLACHAGHEGHPVAWPRALFETLLAWEGADGARGVLASHGELIERCEVNDAGVLKDFDTPEDVAGDPRVCQSSE